VRLGAIAARGLAISPASRARLESRLCELEIISGSEALLARGRLPVRRRLIAGGRLIGGGETVAWRRRRLRGWLGGWLGG
jgi:hypothetical protein